MNGNKKIIIKKWQELSPDELSQMNASHEREWQSGDMSEEYHGENIFFLIKDGDTILAQGQLIPIDGVVFNGEKFDIMGVGGIIANEKGQGYGRQIMDAIKDYLTEHHITGVGFTGLDDFYEKCGFKTDKDAIKRFVHIVGDERRINTESDRVCYLDSDDKFMGKVLSHPDLDVLLPRDPDW